MHSRSLLLTATLVASVYSSTAIGESSLYSLFGHDGVVIATMKLASVPASHVDIISLAFSARGQEIFGLGPLYYGSFDTMGGPDAMFLDDLESGLTGFDANGSQFATAYDYDPPPSTLTSVLSNPRFAITATIFEQDFVDELVYDFGNGDDAIVAQGHWQSVPEPASKGVLAFGWLILLRFLRAKKN